MNLHEYQAKKLFARFGVPAGEGRTARSVKQAYAAADDLGGERWVVKAQVHAGGRGKAGGVKICDGREQLAAAVEGMLGTRLRTPQTGSEGLPVQAVYVEKPAAIARELYLSALVDRSSQRIVFMASAAGGVNIEEVAATTPEKILHVAVHPATGFQDYQGRRLGFFLGLDKKQVGELVGILRGLYRLFVDLDASLVEVNPLIVTEEGRLLALDAKLNLDDNALFRHSELAEMRDPSQEDAREAEAAEYGLSYITLDGDIGCMVNGAGLAMGTMDLVKLHGGEPANFLDVGGNATAERVTAAFKLILSGAHVKAILVNIFGGIVRCDLIAEGIIQAVQEVGVSVPVVVRLEGTNAEQGRRMLDDAGLEITAADNLTDAAQKVVAAAAHPQ